MSFWAEIVVELIQIVNQMNGKVIRGVKMLAEAQTLEKIVIQAQQLSPEYRLRLIQRITDTLIPSFPRQSKPVQFGKYKTGKISTLADFAVAEWRPTDKELNGE